MGLKFRENVGGGIVIGGQLNTDWADLGGATQANAVANAQTSGFANSQSFADIAGPFGTVRLGSPNNYTLTNAISVASPAFSTGVGGAYSTAFAIANGVGTGTTGLGGTVSAGAIGNTGVGARAIRIANTVQYSSPVFNGLSAHIGITPQNNNVTNGAATTTALGAGNTVGVKEYALRYTNGPIDAMYTSIKYEVGSNGTTQSRLTAATPGSTPSLSTASLTGSYTNTQNLLGATYTVMPTLKLHGGLGTFSSSDNSAKGKSTQLGVTYTMGNIDILGMMAKVDDTAPVIGAATAPTNADRKMTGLGVNYNLSKTSRVYLRYDDINYNTNVTATGSAVKRTAVGISKSF